LTLSARNDIMWSS